MKNKKLWIAMSILILILMLFLSRWFLDKKTNDLTNYARNLLSVNRYESALMTLDNNPWLIKTNKNFLMVKSLCLISKKIANANEFTKDEENAIRNNVELLNSKKLNGKDFWDLGFIYENLDEQEKALEYYQKTLDSSTIKDSKQRSDLLSDMAHIYEALDNKSKANEYYEKSVKEDKNNLIAKWRYMWRVLDIDSSVDREKAKIFAKEIVDSKEILSSPIKEDSYNLLGRVCLIEKLGLDDGVCLKYFEDSLKINDKYTSTYDNLSSYYLDKMVSNDLFYVAVSDKTINDENIKMVLNYIGESMVINDTRAWPYIYSSVVNELIDQRGIAKDHLRKALVLVENDNTLWGETKNKVKAIIYFKLALLDSRKETIKVDLDLAIKNNSEIRTRLLELAQNNPKDAKIQWLISALDK
jgi:tetratricopeptide (TPR) repeat protein